MDVREKLVALLKKFVPTVWHEDCDEIRHPKCDEIQCSECIADRLIQNGVTITPAAPGPTESDPDIMELCFHNGEAHMKEKIIAQFQSVAAAMPCITIAQAIKMVEEL